MDLRNLRKSGRKPPQRWPNRRCTKCGVRLNEKNCRLKSIQNNVFPLYFSYCKPCHRKLYRQYNKKYAERQRFNQLKRKYNLSRERFLTMMKQQNNRCGICRKGGVALEVDHKHDSKKRVRGLLCHKCNTGIGLLQDNIRVVRSALSYLQKNAR